MPEESMSISTAPAAGLPGVATLLRLAWRRYAAHWQLWALIALPPAALSALSVFLFPQTEGGSLAPGVLAQPLLYGLLMLAMVVVQLLSTLALIIAAREPLTVSHAYRSASHLFLAYIGIALLTGLIVWGGFVLLLIPGIIFSIWFAFAPYILVTEGTRGMDALLKSKAYVAGQWWGILGRMLILILVAIAASFLSAILPQVVASLLLPLFLVPFVTLYIFSLYENVKLQKGDVPDTYSSKEKRIFLGAGLLGVLIIVGLIAWGGFAVLQMPSASL